MKLNKEPFMTNEMKMTTIVIVGILLFVTILGVFMKTIPPTKGDFELAKIACSNKLKEFHYEYSFGSGKTNPKFTCK